MTNTNSTKVFVSTEGFTTRRLNPPKDGFTQIRNDLIRDSNLSANAFRLLCYLLGHEETFELKWGKAGAKVLNVSPNTRIKVMRELFEKGYIAWIKRGKVLAVSDVPMESPSDVGTVTAGEPMGVEVTDSAATSSDGGSSDFEHSKNEPHKKTNLSKNTTNTYSEVPSASKQVSKTRKEDSSKPGPGSRPHASTIMSSDVDGAKTWIEERIGRGLDSTEDRYAQRRLENWESTGRTWPAIVNQVWRAIEKGEREDMPPTILRSIATASRGSGI